MARYGARHTLIPLRIHVLFVRTLGSHSKQIEWGFFHLFFVLGEHNYHVRIFNKNVREHNAVIPFFHEFISNTYAIKIYYTVYID